MRDSADRAVSFADNAENRLFGVTWNNRWNSPKPRFLLCRRAESTHPFRARKARTPRLYWFCDKFALSLRRAHSQDGRVAENGNPASTNLNDIPIAVVVVP